MFDVERGSNGRPGRDSTTQRPFMRLQPWCSVTSLMTWQRNQHSRYRSGCSCHPAGERGSTEPEGEEPTLQSPELEEEEPPSPDLEGEELQAQPPVGGTGSLSPAVGGTSNLSPAVGGTGSLSSAVGGTGSLSSAVGGTGSICWVGVESCMQGNMTGMDMYGIGSNITAASYWGGTGSNTRPTSTAGEAGSATVQGCLPCTAQGCLPCTAQG
ncbi:UNVERIFIED_CONTAM: hypothetical protein FKN15_048164 [Acipenser sinensis]